MVEETTQEKENSPEKTEETEAPDTPPEETPEEPEKPEGESAEGEEEGAEDTEDDDYRKELEEERELRLKRDEELKKARHKIVILEKKEKKDEFGEEEEEPPLTKEDIREMIKAETGSVQKNLQKAQATDKIRALVGGNKALQDLAQFHYENTINPTGDLERDVKRAVLLANEKRVERNHSEILRALKSKEMKSRGRGPGQKVPLKQGPPPLSPQDQKLVDQSRGRIRWDQAKQSWVRLDPRTKNWIPVDMSGITTGFERKK